MLTHFSLCTGIGGLDLAAEWAGFETVGQCEIREYQSKVLALRFEGVKNYHDVRTVTAGRLRADGIEPESLTVLSAGFPCQPYSLAGKGLGDGDERDLWGEVARCIGELRPRWFVGENTSGLIQRDNGRYFRRVLSDLTALGYSVSWGMWGACDVGAPHKRERVFIVAHNACVGKEKTTQRLERTSNEFKRCDRAWIVSDSYGQEKLQLERCKQNIGRRSCDYNWWKTEPDVVRVVHGLPSRVDRLECLGNAVVPQQAYPIFKAIADYELSLAELVL